MLTFKKGESYQSEWKKVEEFNNQGLPKSALEIVEKIYQQALKDDNHAQIVKSIAQRTQLKASFEEEPAVSLIANLKEELDGSKYPVTPVLQSMLAQSYWTYYQQNRWTILERTRVSDDDSEDMLTWDAEKFVSEAINYYRQSLQEPDKLQRTELGLYDDILQKADGSRRYRPTLYDFLAHRALDFYRNDETGLTRPAYQFRVEGEEPFGPAGEFAAIDFATRDSLSLEFHAIRLMQDVIAFHLGDQQPDALVDIDLIRLNYLKDKSVSERRDSLFVDALEKLRKNHAGHPVSAWVSYELAAYYMQQGLQYQPGGEINKDDRRRADRICQQAIDRFPDSDGAKNCRALQAQLRRKTLAIDIEQVNLPDKPFLALISYQNVDKAYLRAIAVSPEDQEEFAASQQGNVNLDKQLEYYRKRPVAQEWTIDLPDDGDLNPHRVEIEMPSLPPGRYIFLVGTDQGYCNRDQGVAIGKTWISNLGLLQKQADKDQTVFFVFDRTSGKPQAGAQITFWKQEYDRKARRSLMKIAKKMETGEKGRLVVDESDLGRGRYQADVRVGSDRLFLDDFFNMRAGYTRNKPHPVNKTTFFTDRAIYRPGQTLYFKGILLNGSIDGHQVRPNAKTTVRLYDVNGQEVSSLDLLSNEYGTVSGTFALPSAGLTGMMRIENGEGQASFSVEEYKRPRFEVTFEPVTGSYRLEEDVAVEGKAVSYAGANLDGAEVRYRIVRRARFPYYWGFWKRPWFPASSEVEIANGSLKTDGKGKFAVTFKALADKTIPADQKPVFNYEVHADVVDITGETHSAVANVSVGYVALSADINVPESINRREAGPLEITTANLNGEFEPASGTVEVFRLKAPGRIFSERLWDDPDRFVMNKDDFYRKFPNAPFNDEDDFRNWELGKSVQKSNFDTAKEKTCQLSGVKDWEEGYYCLQLESKDKFGNDLKVVKFFSLYDLQSDQIPDNALHWNSIVKAAGEPGEKALFVWGSAVDKVYAWLEVYHQNRIIDARWIKADAGKNRLELPIKEEHRGNFSYSLFFVKHGRVLEQSGVITVPWSNKQLTISYETFRDKLKPGQQEEWRLKIAGPQGEKVAAEMAAAMYDASLDAFVGHNWQFNIYPTFGHAGYIAGLRNKTAFASGSYRASGDGWNPHYNFVSKQYDALSWYPAFGINYGMMRRGGRLMSMGAVQEGAVAMDLSQAKEAMPPGAPVAMMADDAAAGYEAEAADVAAYQDGSAGASQSGDIAVRSNLNETAFFFPDLRTNEQGEVLVSFTMPEALTRWKLLGLAHTKNLEFALTEKEVVTQKELMVVPNAPRFLREGDRIVMTAKVVNLSETALSGTAWLQLFDAVSMKPLDDQLGNNKSEVAFKAAAGESAALSWALKIPDGIQAVTYRVIAKAGNFSDGEEDAMPVLTNRMLVTESLPLPIRGKQTKTYTFDKLVNAKQSSTLRHHNLTLEFTSNPAWYAVQALPYLMEYPYECSEQIFSRYYANKLASYIANSNPKIKRVFDQWKNTDALLSNLEKNQELKSLLLEETPWLRDAQNESERKKRIGLLFDLNRMSNELNNALRKLQQMQNPSGAWPWFPEMRDNRFITQHIVTGMGHLRYLGIEDILKDQTTGAMLNNAVRFLDEEMAEDFRRLQERKTNMEEDHLSQTTIHYLYARSYFREFPVDDQHQKAFDYWKSQSEKYWVQQNKYLQGMIALALHRYENTKVPAAVIKSLSEHAIHDEEMGMYWRDPLGYFWYQAPIERQALFIELYEEVAKDRKAVDDMKAWLLKQKQTQDWKTTKATAEACYALLLRGSDQLASDALVEVSLGGEVVNVANRDDVKVEVGTGYFKTSWKGGDIQPKMGNVSVTKSDDGVAWGALYWQYFEQLDKITPHETPLSLKKQVFLQVNTDGGPQLKELAGSVKLKPGDLLKVRIELRVDRAMEYVHMKDMRASGLDPLNVLSQYKFQGGLGYYESTRDASTNFFMGWLPKGTFVFEYPLRVTHEGEFSNGITTIQCMYAPEFTSHSEGIRLSVGN